MLTCQQIAEFLADYLDHQLPWRQQALFHIHLLGCRDCRRYIASYRKTVQAVRSLATPQEKPAETVPAAPPELIHAILAARKEAAQGDK